MAEEMASLKYLQQNDLAIPLGVRVIFPVHKPLCLYQTSVPPDHCGPKGGNPLQKCGSNCNRWNFRAEGTAHKRYLELWIGVSCWDDL